VVVGGGQRRHARPARSLELTGAHIDQPYGMVVDHPLDPSPGQRGRTARHQPRRYPHGDRRLAHRYLGAPSPDLETEIEESTSEPLVAEHQHVRCPRDAVLDADLVEAGQQGRRELVDVHRAAGDERG
jgi:hypothetical protein